MYTARLLLPTMQQFHQSTPPASISIGLKLQKTLLERLKGEQYSSRYVAFYVGCSDLTSSQSTCGIAVAVIKTAFSSNHTF
jgi:hypothetical protein